MNILFHSWEFPPNGGGVGVYILNMGMALAEQGHRVTIVTGKANNLPESEYKSGLHILRKYGRNEIGSKRVCDILLKLSDETSIDWIEGADHLGECARLLKINNRPPVVIKIHSCNILKTLRESQILYSWQRFITWLAIVRKWKEYHREKYCIEHADYLLAPSHRIVHELKKQRLRLPRKIEVIPNTLIPLKSDYSLNQEYIKPTLLFVGRIDIGKGIQYLPDIVRNLGIVDLRLEIAGSSSYARGLGPLKKWLKVRLAKCDCEVRFLGWLDEIELAEAFKRAWVVIVPSRWDNFPTVILEAMKYAKPVVASPHGGIPEMLEETESVIAFPESLEFIDGIRKFINNKKYRKNAGKTMQKKLKTSYAPEHIADKYIELTKQICLRKTQN